MIFQGFFRGWGYKTGRFPPELTPAGVNSSWCCGAVALPECLKHEPVARVVLGEHADTAHRSDEKRAAGRDEVPRPSELRSGWERPAMVTRAGARVLIRGRSRCCLYESNKRDPNAARNTPAGYQSGRYN